MTFNQLLQIVYVIWVLFLRNICNILGIFNIIIFELLSWSKFLVRFPDRKWIYHNFLKVVNFETITSSMLIQRYFSRLTSLYNHIHVLAVFHNFESIQKGILCSLTTTHKFNAHVCVGSNSFSHHQVEKRTNVDRKPREIVDLIKTYVEQPCRLCPLTAVHLMALFIKGRSRG